MWLVLYWSTFALIALSFHLSLTGSEAGADMVETAVWEFPGAGQEDASIPRPVDCGPVEKGAEVIMEGPAEFACM